MGVDYVRKRVTIAFRNCFRAAARHPLLTFMACVLFSTHQLFPALFSLLVHASPVFASTLILLGTLLFYGHKNAPQIQKEATSHHHEIHSLVFGGMGNNESDHETYHGHKFGSSIKQEANSGLSNRRPVMVTRGGRFQSFGTGNVRLKSNDGSRRSSFDHPHSVLRHLEDDSKGWETGSSASASVTDMFPMLGDIHPLMQSDDDDDHYDHEGVEVKDYDDHDDDDDDESDITWSGNHRNMMNLEALEVQRNQRMESLIARQKAIKNMRMMAEKNMVNVIDTHISAARNTQFDLPKNIIPRRNSIDIPYDPRPGPTLQINQASGYRQRRSDIGIAGHTTIDPYPIPNRIRSETITIGPTHTSGFNEHIIPRRRVSENDDIVKVHQAAKGYDRSNVVKKSGYEDKTSNKSSSSSFCDVTDDMHDDDKEEDFGSVENSPKSKDLQDLKNKGDTDTDTSDSDTEEAGGLPQKLKSWFRWKA